MWSGDQRRSSLVDDDEATARAAACYDLLALVLGKPVVDLLFRLVWSVYDEDFCFSQKITPKLRLHGYDWLKVIYSNHSKEDL